MSDFLMIVPEGWTKLDIDACQVIPGVTLATIDSYINSQAFGVLANELINGGILPEGSVIIEAILFNGEIFLVRLG